MVLKCQIPLSLQVQLRSMQIVFEQSLYPILLKRRAQLSIRRMPSPYGVPVDSEINLKQPLYPKNIGGCPRVTRTAGVDIGRTRGIRIRATRAGVKESAFAGAGVAGLLPPGNNFPFDLLLV